jgi:hypothetical protein
MGPWTGGQRVNGSPLVGLIGYKRSGKDTFAAGLVEVGFQRVAFADPLREALYRQNPIVGDYSLPNDWALRQRRVQDVVDAIGWEGAKEYVHEIRAQLQRLGTDAIRHLDNEFWLRIACQNFDDRTTGVVVTDCRFPNEADAIRERGGTIVRVVRPGFDPEPDAHVSERALDDYAEDVLVVNDKTQEALRTMARAILAP